jgi:hypothetical protein
MAPIEFLGWFFRTSVDELIDKLINNTSKNENDVFMTFEEADYTHVPLNDGYFEYFAGERAWPGYLKKLEEIEKKTGYELIKRD